MTSLLVPGKNPRIHLSHSECARVRIRSTTDRSYILLLFSRTVQLSPVAQPDYDSGTASDRHNPEKIPMTRSRTSGVERTVIRRQRVENRFGRSAAAVVTKIVI